MNIIVESSNGTNIHKISNSGSKLISSQLSAHKTIVVNDYSSNGYSVENEDGKMQVIDDMSVGS